MKTFVVERYVKYTYVIDASTEEDAIQAVRSDDFDPVELDTQEYNVYELEEKENA